MIAPNMATMLSFIFTDAKIDFEALQSLISDVNARTFNCITVDSDTSTSDTVLVFATGAADHNLIERADDPALREFNIALEDVSRDLAQQIVRDGEGATKFITINVTEAEDNHSARKIGHSIANSPLVKTAVAGEDPNWGRIVMAIGKSGEAADRDKIGIRIGGIEIASHGQAIDPYEEGPVAKHMRGDEINIEVSVGIGSGVGTVWTCDLTQRYITINADYRS